MKTACVLVAAGSGTRLGAQKPKALVECGGVTLIERALANVCAVPEIHDVVVVAPASHSAEFHSILDACVPASHAQRVKCVGGGPSRQASVKNGLDHTKKTAPTHVLIHDAARCATPASLMSDVVGALRDGAKAVVPAVKVTDSLRYVSGGVADREALRAVQTPQGFAAPDIYAAHDRYAARGSDEQHAASDDATLVEQDGIDVVLVPGDPLAHKITTTTDLVVMERLLQL